MQLFTLTLAIAGLAVAHDMPEAPDSADAPTSGLPDLSKIPACALTCLTQSIAHTPCTVTDVQCQCTTGAAAIAAALTPCLCQSTCTPEELGTTMTISMGICKTALEAKGQKFDAPPISPDICKQMAGAGGASAPPAAAPVAPAGAGAAPAEAPASPATAPGHATPPPPPSYGYSYGPNVTNVTNSTGVPPIQPSTGVATSLGVDTPMMVSAAFLGLVGIGLMAL